MNEIHLIRPWKQKGFYHLLIWTIFISYELLCIFSTVGLARQLLHYGIYYPLYIGLFYFNAHIILDLSFFRTKRPYLTATLLIVLEIALFGFFKALVDCLLSGEGFTIPKAMFTRAYILSNIFRQIFFIGFSVAYWSMLYFTRYRDKNQQLEIQKLRQEANTLELENKYISVENAYLQNQVSPHLIFNSLNFIYYAVYQLSDRAGRGIMLLSNLLRYSLTAGGANQDFSLLLQETEQIRHLVELDRMRFKEDRYITFSQTGDLNGKKILPLALVTLVENMIKHGELSDPENPAKAQLDIGQNQLTFTTVNNKRENTPYPKTGLGLHNLKKRLSNAYGDKYGLVIVEDEQRFSIKLMIEL